MKSFLIMLCLFTSSLSYSDSCLLDIKETQRSQIRSLDVFIWNKNISLTEQITLDRMSVNGVLNSKSNAMEELKSTLLNLKQADPNFYKDCKIKTYDCTVEPRFIDFAGRPYAHYISVIGREDLWDQRFNFIDPVRTVQSFDNDDSDYNYCHFIDEHKECIVTQTSLKVMNHAFVENGQYDPHRDVWITKLIDHDNKHYNFLDYWKLGKQYEKIGLCSFDLPDRSNGLGPNCEINKIKESVWHKDKYAIRIGSSLGYFSIKDLKQFQKSANKNNLLKVLKQVIGQDCTFNLNQEDYNNLKLYHLDYLNKYSLPEDKEH